MKMGGHQDRAIRLPCPARASCPPPLEETRQRDRPCTQAVYPQHLRDSSLVQTAFAPSPALKNRSIAIVAAAPNPSPTSATLGRESVRFRAFDTLPHPREAGPCAADDGHTGPERPMLFQIFASTEHAITGEEVNLGAEGEEAEENQHEGSGTLAPFVHSEK